MVMMMMIQMQQFLSLLDVRMGDGFQQQLQHSRTRTDSGRTSALDDVVYGEDQ